MIIKYSYNKIKEHAHINHLIKKNLSSIYQNLLNDYFPFMLQST